ncbi:adenylate/guanylate cyclase domain-containing protein [Eudoraea adriatica]|uniref:adenylate/guanylate cyclase domain-containing protein n=1 Tax=Eudoraea adriatica TaxID=446681 RepID=UPI001F0B281E|nr:adenylate/guanylate cyclase domain-containing protein [Eudoraea adriatica]
MVDALSALGFAYFRIGNFPKALESYKKGLDLAEKANDKAGVAYLLLRTGFIYHDNSDIISALKYYQRSLKIFEEIEDLDGIGSVYNEYGSIYRTEKEYDKALDYYLKSIAINDELNYESDNSAIYLNIGDLYLSQKNFLKALDYFQKGLIIYEKTGDKLGIASGLAGIGNVYSENGNENQALEYLKSSLKISEEIDDIQGSAATLLSIGDIYADQGKYSESLESCKKSLTLAKDLGDIGNQEGSCDCLYTAYKAIGNLNQALVYHEQMLVFTDSLKTEETAKKIQQMEFSAQVLADSLLQVEKDMKVETAHQIEVRQKDRNRNLSIAAGLFFLLLSGGLFSRWRYVRKAKAIIEKEKNRSENLLLNILPSEIAEELKEKGSADARDFDMVSILFSDFIGFTEVSEKQTAKELVAEINHCFKAFDNICEKYGIEKIKTIGDAYMAAGGLPVTSDDSAKNAVLAALEMQSFIINRKVQKEAKNEIPFEMRVGIHTGPVVAGIVGVKKFQYDIWGDTVNIASRMESAGAIEKVNISQDTYELINEDPRFIFEARGKINVKGKGELEMYFVTGRL